jgi:hypothetical protein
MTFQLQGSGDTAAAGLLECGWQQAEPGGGAFSLEAAGAVMRHVEDHAQWDSYALDASALPPPAIHRVLYQNSRLPGPIKWVARGDGAVACRVDIPKQWSALGKAWSRGATVSPADSPWRAWAASLTTVVTAESPAVEPHDLDLAPLVAGLQQAGWLASVDDGQLRVHVQMRDLYCDIRLEHCSPSELRVAATLADFTGLAVVSRRAIRSLALSANTRLPFVRFAVSSIGGKRVLRAEVAFSGSSARVLGEWLATAVEAVYTAVLLCAREMLALRDAALAKLVLAAVAA